MFTGKRLDARPPDARARDPRPFSTSPLAMSSATLALALALAALAPCASGADPAPSPAATPAPASAASTEAKPKEDKDKLPSLEEATKGFELINNNADHNEPTFFGVYRKDEQVLALIPKQLLNKPWLLGTSIAAGPVAVGEQLGSAALEWRRRDKFLDLYEPELRYTSTTKPTLSEGVKRAFTDRYVGSAKVMSETHEALLIDLTGFLTGSMKTLVGSFFGGMDTSAMSLDEVKAFNQNVELALTAPLRMPQYFYWMQMQDGQLQTLHFSFSALHDNPDFVQRPADPRVGYWIHATRDLGRHTPLETDYVRTIEHWDLRKSDPKASISPPVKPIVFYIEKTVPQAYRVYVRRGIEAWNEAFRAIGIENAIEVRQQTDSQYANLDPEDVRYNFVRWVPTGYGYAIGLHRTDPRTGEILNADVVIDDGWLSAWTDEYPLLTQEAASERLDAMRRNPEFAPVARQLEARDRERGVLPAKVDLEALRKDPTLGARLSERQRAELVRTVAFDSAPGVLTEQDPSQTCRCEYTKRLGEEMAVARLATLFDRADDDDAPTEPLIDGVPENLVAQSLVELTAHEVGHVLGLRHNFAASGWKPASAIDSYTDPSQEPPAASVMDYLGTFISDVGKPQGVYNMTRIGPYDRWAIAYGYEDADADALKALLAKSVEPQNHYMTDEDVFSVDPTAMPYDFGSDPVEGRTRELRRIDYLRGRLLDRLAKSGENWSKVKRAFDTLRFKELIDLWDSTGWIGGTYLSRDFNVDGAHRPLVNVEPERQRGMLHLLIDRLFRESSMPIDRELLNRLQAVQWMDSDFGFQWSGSGAPDVLGNANLAQYLVLNDLLFWCTPRLANQELRTDPSVDALTVPELHKELTNAIWSEFASPPGKDGTERYTNLKPKVSALRRSLQHEHVEQLVDLAYRFRFMPASYQSARLVAIDQLREIARRLKAWSDDVGAAPGGLGLDDYTRIHVRENLALIDATLEAQVTRAP